MEPIQKVWIEIVVPGWFPKASMLGQPFSDRSCMDFIGSLESLGWPIRGGPGFVLWGFPVAFFLFLGCEIGLFVVPPLNGAAQLRTGQRGR